MEMVQQVLPAELNRKLAAPSPPVVIDVRQPQEIAAEGRIAAALLIPLNEVPQRLGEIPQGREVVCVCKMGMRSMNAAAFLRQRGHDAKNMAGGMAAWTAAGLPVQR